MKEQFDIAALRLAQLVLEKSRPGQLRDARKLAKSILAECDDEPKVEPKPVCSDPVDGHIRWMIRRDMPEVLEIEACSFAFPWSEDDFIFCLRQRNFIGMVVEHDERIVGFMIYELHKARLHVINFAVHSGFRRRCVGRSMVDELISKLSPQCRSRIRLEVGADNLGAQKFFASMGFRATCLLENFYAAAKVDAISFEYCIGEPSNA